MLTLSGVGRFPPQAHKPPRVLWAGIDDQPALLQLQQQVKVTLTTLDYQADEWPFHPHIALARLKTEKPLTALDAFLNKHSAFQTAAIPVNQFALFSSTLTPQGARYKKEMVYTLDHA
jgi:2'-5' RNA ligase